MIENKMYLLAVDLIKKRYPKGWGETAVIRTEEDDYYTSVPIEVKNESASLCIETGAICEAHKYNKKVTHCLCVVRDDEKSDFKVLTPCGICQERLNYWTGEVLVGVTNEKNNLKFVALKELQPYHWTNAYK